MDNGIIMDNYGLLLWLHHLLLYIMDNQYISRVSGISSVRRLAAAVPSAPRRRARQSSAAPRGAAAPLGTVRLGASGDGKVGRFRGRFSGEKWWKHHKTPGNSWEKIWKNCVFDWMILDYVDFTCKIGGLPQTWQNQTRKNRRFCWKRLDHWTINFLVNSHPNNGQEYDQSRDVHHTSGP